MVAASRPSRPLRAEDFSFDEVYRGRHILGTRTGADGKAAFDGGEWHVTVDGRPLHLMRRAEGTYPSMVDHYQSYPTPLDGRARPSTSSAPRSSCVTWTRRGATWRGAATTMVYMRKDVSTLTGAERCRFVAATLEAKRRGEYDEFVRMHIDCYVSDGDGGLRTAHMAPSFLPWHRRFLLDLDLDLERAPRRGAATQG